MKKKTYADHSDEELPAEQGAAAAPSLPKLLLTWAKVGVGSFGGGAATQYLIQEHFIYRNHWITQDEYSSIIGMCQLAPGINILSYTILIGKKLGGARGVAVSLLGLVLPSAALTVALTALYTLVRQYDSIHSALRIAYASILGITFATNWRNVSPIFRKNQKKGPAALGVTIAIAVGSGAAYVLFQPSVILLYLVGGVCGGTAYWAFSGKKAGN